METFVLWYILQHLKPQSDHTLFLIQFIDEKKKVVDKIAEEAKNSQKAWDYLMPERNITWKNPSFWYRIFFCIILFDYLFITLT